MVVRVVPPNVDEAVIKAACRTAGDSSKQTALTLARAKSHDVVGIAPTSVVIGADQILDLDGVWLDKPRDRVDAADQLRRLANRTHRLVTGVSLVQQDRETWNYCDIATLSMMALDEATIERYLDAIGDAAYESVGAYQIERQGIGLFERIDGDFFTILGLPLLPLIGALRAHGLLIP